MKRNNLILAIALVLISATAPRAFAASGCTYPTTLDAYTDKIAGDQLTVALLNQMMCDIEKLQSGPVRPNDGSAGAPAYAFRGSASSGLFLSSGNIGVTLAGSERLRINSTGSLLVDNAAVTGVGDGNIVLDNDRNLLWVNQAQTTAANLFIKATTLDTLSFGTAATEQLNIAGNGAVRLGNSASTGVGANDLVMKNNTFHRWVNAAGTSTEIYIHGNPSNHMRFNLPAADGQLYQFNWGETPLFQITRELGGAGLIFTAESTLDQSAPAANQAVIYTRDNGGGKTQLCARFNTGAVQCFASEP